MELRVIRTLTGRTPLPVGRSAERDWAPRARPVPAPRAELRMKGRVRGSGSLAERRLESAWAGRLWLGEAPEREALAAHPPSGGQLCCLWRGVRDDRPPTLLYLRSFILLRLSVRGRLAYFGEATMAIRTPASRWRAPRIARSSGLSRRPGPLEQHQSGVNRRARGPVLGHAHLDQGAHRR